MLRKTQHCRTIVIAINIRQSFQNCIFVTLQIVLDMAVCTSFIYRNFFRKMELIFKTLTLEYIFL